MLRRAGFGFLIAVLLAGCSQPQSTQSLPPDSLGSTAPNSGYARVTADIFKGGMTPSKMLRLQLEGRLPAPIPVKALRSELERQGHTRPHLTSHAAAKVALWASNTNFSYLVGITGTGQTASAIDLVQNGCYYPVALKVDHLQNVWTPCEATPSFNGSGVLQEYGPSGTLKNQYNPACPSNVATCASFEGYGYDSGIDSSGNLFASMNLYSIETCNPDCVSNLGAGFEWWPKGNSSATPRLISVGPSCAPVCGVGYMDVDGSGNLWFDFAGYDSGGTFGFGLGEITNPTTHPVFRIVEPLGTYRFFGGVYVSNGGKTLNVVDQIALTISQYHLPVANGALPFNVLGPTPTTAFGVADPTAGNFDHADKTMALGDAGGWADIGKIGLNRWTVQTNPNFYSGITGAAFTPSDK